MSFEKQRLILQIPHPHNEFDGHFSALLPGAAGFPVAPQPAPRLGSFGGA
jgi:hypothetical protein